MPECRKCGRMQATAELRRTTRGFLCKDNGPGTRCWTIARELAQAERERRAARRREAAQAAGAAA